MSTYEAARETRRLGSVAVTYLPDGYGLLNPSAVFPGWHGHARHLTADGLLAVSVGSFLISSPDRVILVDLGLGEVEFEIPGLAAFSSGGLLKSLAAEGYTPEDVDTVLYTHLHHDHVGWTTDVAPRPGVAAATPSGLTFAHARHLAAEAEWRHWRGTADPVGPDPVAVQEPLDGVLEFVADGETIAPGVRVRYAPGHTPGHLAVEVAVCDQRLLILGDALHTRAQMDEPALGFVFDVDGERARATRKALLAQGTPLAGGHFTGSVFGPLTNG